MGAASPAASDLSRRGALYWENLFSLSAAELAQQWEDVAPWLRDSAHFCVNSMFRAGRGRSTIAGLPPAWRREISLRFLNAAYVDLGRPDSKRRAQQMTWQQGVLEVERLMQSGALPPASLVARSGRGLYVFWLLADEADPLQPPRAWPNTIRLYKAVNEAVGQSLTALAADTGAHDAARTLRVPGTRHRHTGTLAHYLACTVRGQIPIYTLSQLATCFGVSSALAETPWRKTKRPGTVPARRRGQEQLYDYRCHDLVALERHCGGWPQGRRRFHLQLFTTFLWARGFRQPEALRFTQAMARRCQPPYPSDPNDVALDTLVKTVFNPPRKRYSNAGLCRWLGVTPELARQLKLRTIVPEEVGLERRPVGGQRAKQQAARREFIRHFYQQQGEKISCRRLQRALEAAGFTVSHETVNCDLRALKADGVLGKAALAADGAKHQE
jgi:hypothetical protein